MVVKKNALPAGADFCGEVEAADLEQIQRFEDIDDRDMRIEPDTKGIGGKGGDQLLQADYGRQGHNCITDAVRQDYVNALLCQGKSPFFIVGPIGVTI